MKYILFGTGDYYERYKKWFNKGDVVALLDNSAEKQNTMIDGIKVLSPQDVVMLDYDAVIILSFYVKAMKAQLIELGVDEKCIYHFYDLHKLFTKRDLCKPIQFYGGAGEIIKKGKCRKRILLLSHDLLLGGPSIALFHAASVLIKRGYQVVYASMLDGPLRQTLLSSRIPVVVDVNLQVETMKDADWVSGFSLIICNTINYHVFLSERNSSIPVIWWLHDASFFFDGVDLGLLQSLDRKNLRVCSVGPIPERAIHKYIPDISVEMLLYGVKDNGVNDIAALTRRPCADEKICFVMIGFVGEIKGHDILIQAIRMLTDKIREQAAFYFVGQNGSMTAHGLKEEAKDIPEIVMTGVVGREEIHRILNGADALLCPSREDSMPTVAAEAMMHSVPCIISDATGTAEYIKDGENGFIVPNENVEALADRIIWCVEHREELERMGKKARIVYEQVFSMEVFEEKLMEIVGECLR